ncbi:MAG: hypothetical protein K5867_05965 [Bacteroidales bacterium]|nr:hypothetical protein [Bacteroidales bacterium]
MTSKEQIAKVSEMASKLPLAEILDTLEGVAKLVPGIGNIVRIVIKVLRLLMKLKPATAK